jgi:RNA polymerase sigma-70 factor (ECF subfamily)
VVLWARWRTRSLEDGVWKIKVLLVQPLDRRKSLSEPRRSSGRCGDDRDVSAEPDRNDAPRALLALYDDALPVVYGYFVRRCGDRGTAEDLTSETFLAAMDAARKDAPPPITVPWLIGVARHKLADHYRRGQDRFSVPVADVPEPADPADDWDAELDRIVAESVLAKLSEQHRTVLALRYMDDCSVPECAELIGRTVHATEALLVRARRAFRQHYPEPEGGKS